MYDFEAVYKACSLTLVFAENPTLERFVEITSFVLFFAHKKQPVPPSFEIVAHNRHTFKPIN